MKRVDAVKIIRRTNKHLASTDRQLKFSKMASGPFYLLRGDYATYLARCKGIFSAKKLATWCVGDLHAANFGAFTSGQGSLEFGLNDFDTGHIDDPRYDVLRMASSIVLLAAGNGLSRNQGYGLAVSFAQAYYDRIADCARYPTLCTVPVTADHLAATGPVCRWLHDLGRIDHDDQYRRKWLSGSKIRVIKGKTATISKREYRAVADAVCAATGSAVFDVVRRIAGTGSLGCARYYALTAQGVILDVKENSNAESAVSAERYLLASPDLFARSLEITLPGGKTKQFTLHRLNRCKASYPLLPERGKKIKKALFLGDYGNFLRICRTWGTALASAHVLASERDPRLGSSFAKRALKVFGDRNSFSALLVSHAVKFARETDLDFKRFKRLYKHGRLK